MRRVLLSAIGAVIIGALAALIGGLLLGWFTNSKPGGVPKVTQEILFEPWKLSVKTNTGMPDIHITSQHAGHCWIQVICPYPSPRSGTLLNLTIPLPHSRYTGARPLRGSLFLLVGKTAPLLQLQPLLRQEEKKATFAARAAASAGVSIEIGNPGPLSNNGTAIQT